MFLQIVISCSVFAAVLMLVLAGPEAFSQPVRRWREHQETAYRRELSELFVTDWKPGTVTYVTMLAAVVVLGVVLWLSGSLIVAGLSAAGVWLLPRLVFRSLREQRLERLDGQLVDGLELLANAVKAGQALPQALEVVASQMLPPLSQEFGLMVQEYQLLGVPLDQVLINARDRLASKNFALATAALLVSREKGGNLLETLARIQG